MVAVYWCSPTSYLIVQGHGVDFRLWVFIDQVRLVIINILFHCITTFGVILPIHTCWIAYSLGGLLKAWQSILRLHFCILHFSSVICRWRSVNRLFMVTVRWLATWDDRSSTRRSWWSMRTHAYRTARVKPFALCNTSHFRSLLRAPSSSLPREVSHDLSRPDPCPGPVSLQSWDVGGAWLAIVAPRGTAPARLVTACPISMPRPSIRSAAWRPWPAGRPWPSRVLRVGSFFKRALFSVHGPLWGRMTPTALVMCSIACRLGKILI